MHTAKLKALVPSVARARRAALAASILVVMFVAACGNRMDTAPLVAGAIAITTPDGAVPVTGTMQFVATVTDASGNVIALAPTWSVANGGGTITPDGLFTAGDVAGTFDNTIVATSGSVTATSTVTVSAGALATISVHPSTVTLAAGSVQQFTAFGMDAHGNLVAIANRVWSVAALGGTIDTAGLFTAGTTAGTFTSTITATSGAVSGTGTVAVSGGPLASMTITPLTATLAIGATQQYTVIGRDAHNNIVPATPVWSLEGGGGAIDANGLFTAGTIAGSFAGTIHAMSGLICASASVTVSAGALATITVSPVAPSLASGATQQFTAVGKDAHDNVVAFTPVWSVVASGGTINSATGLFTAGSTAGTFTNTVTATSGAISGTSSVVVTVALPLSITVTPNPASIVAGGTQTFTAVGHGVCSTIVSITPAWSVVAGGGTIDASTGVFTAGTTVGTFTSTVQATAGGVTGTATVTVGPAGVFSIVVTPANPTVLFGASQQFTAVAYDQYLNVQPFTPTWTASASAGTISSTGLFTPKNGADGPFANAITASFGLVQGHASVTIDCGC